MAFTGKPAILVFTLVIVVLAGLLYYQQGAHDCERRLGLLAPTRFMPLDGCQVQVTGEWRSERKMRNSVNEGVKEMQEGAKKAMQGIMGK